MIRVGFTGAGGTGKGTTLIGVRKLLHRFLKKPPFHLYINQSFVQPISCFISPESENWEEITGHQAVMKQAYVFGGQMQSEFVAQDAGRRLERKGRKSVIMSERSSVDYMAYAMRCMKDFPSELEYYMSLTKRWAYENYDLLVYFPMEFTPKDLAKNSWKERTQESQEVTDSIIKDILKELDIPQISVTGSVEKRSSNIVSYILDNWDILEKAYEDS